MLYIMRKIGLVLTITLSASSLVAQIGNLDSSDIIFHFHGTDTSSIIGASMGSVLGDVNGDGFGDFALSSSSPRGTYIFFGGNPLDSFPDMFIKGLVQPARFDVTGDGIDDLIVAEVSGLVNPFGVVYFYKGFNDSLASEPFDSLFPALDSVPNPPTNFAFGSALRADYVDGDSLADLLVLQRNTLGGPTLRYFSGPPTLDTTTDWTFAITNNTHTIGLGNLGFIDFDGDGNLDIYVGFKGDLDTVGIVYLFLGPNFPPQPDITIGYPIEHDTLDLKRFAEGAFNIGDFNADGWDDLGVIFAFLPLIYFGGPNADTLYDIALEYRAGIMARGGDINNDGYDDIVVGGLRSSFDNVDLYLGGPGVDGILDDNLFRSDLPPLFLDKIGYRVNGIGDVNGDFIDDFIFATQNFAFGDPGEVFIIAGNTNIITDVDDETGSLLPDAFELHQNYPNPFNPSTTIEFNLARGGHVELTVYNVLGHRVITLIDKELRAGRHTVTWNAERADGMRVASGIYLYKLDLEGVSRVRKMVLLQ